MKLGKKIRNAGIATKIFVNVIILFVVALVLLGVLNVRPFYKLYEKSALDTGRGFIAMAEQVRLQTIENWDNELYAKDNLSTENIEAVIPILNAEKALKNSLKDVDVEPQICLNFYGSKYNRHTEIDKEALNFLAQKGNDEFMKLDKKTDYFYYYKAFYLTENELKNTHDLYATFLTKKHLKDNTDQEVISQFTQEMSQLKVGDFAGAYRLSVDLRNEEKSAIWQIVRVILIGVLTLLVIILILYFTIRKSLSPLREITESLEQINQGSGDLTHKIPVRNEDEIGKVAMLFNNFIDNLRSIMISVRTSANVVAESSAEMTGHSQSLANVAQEQAASIEETSSSMEEIKATIDSVSDNAKNQARQSDQANDSTVYLASSIMKINEDAQQANVMAEDTHTHALEGEKVLVSTVSSMNDISSSSNKIKEIVTIISDISDQINLLSLNASIEAARAGEHGRGFAVVAEEISKLADQTASSSKEINDLILESDQKVKSGSSLVEKTADGLRRITENVKKTATVMEKIANSSNSLNEMGNDVTQKVTTVHNMSEEISIMMEEQSISSNEIITAIDSINNVTQQVSSGSEELAAASEELSSQADVLLEIVKKFKVD